MYTEDFQPHDETLNMTSLNQMMQDQEDQAIIQDEESSSNHFFQEGFEDDYIPSFMR